MVKVYYSPAYVAAGHSFDTTRKAGWIAASLATNPIPHIELVAPQPLTAEQVSSVHDGGYVRAIETGQPRDLAETQGFTWDRGLWSAVLASNGGVVAAALTALRDGGVAGSLSSGLHHARYARGSGFCTFNGLALAARAALAAGATSVLILDLDAHGGGGTASLLASKSRVWQIDVSVSKFDREPDSNPDRHLWEFVDNSDDYLPTIRQLLAELDRQEMRFDLCLYNAGMDPHESAGGIRGITAEVLADREELVFDWCRKRKLPVAFTLAGGYIGPQLREAGVVGLHRLTLAAAVGFTPTVPEPPLSPEVIAPAMKKRQRLLSTPPDEPTKLRPLPAKPPVAAPRDQPSLSELFTSLGLSMRQDSSVVPPPQPSAATSPSGNVLRPADPQVLGSCADEVAFLKEIQEQPHDEAVRGAYAEWLQGRGDHRAEFLRLRQQYAQISARMNELSQQLDHEWLTLVGEPHTAAEITLLSGRKISLTSLRQWRCYEGWLEGLSSTEANQEMVARFAASEKTSCVVIPIRERPRRESPDLSYPSLPTFVCVGTFQSHPVAGGIDPLSSRLSIMWFQYHIAPPIDPGIRKQIQLVDWEGTAVNKEI